MMILWNIGILFPEPQAPPSGSNAVLSKLPPRIETGPGDLDIVSRFGALVCRLGLLAARQGHLATAMAARATYSIL